MSEPAETTCYDCGCRASHRDSDGWCRNCGEKNGERYLYCTSIDHDKLRAKLGDELAAEVLNECREDY